MEALLTLNEHYISFKVVSQDSGEVIAYKLSMSLMLAELRVNDVYINTNNEGALSYNLKERREQWNRFKDVE